VKKTPRLLALIPALVIILLARRWECNGGFSYHPNGEAWWSETDRESTQGEI